MSTMSSVHGSGGEGVAPAPSASATTDGSPANATLHPRERRPTVAPDSTRDVAQEDFLFHLYRGSELLQENRVLEAKEELEFALTMQPLDPKGQDLLGAVYFRIGLYPRAIQIYEGLTAQFARDVAVKVNLALCYLKTGQPEPARRILRDAVELNPQHKRAWGYLGLALQKLGDLEQAQIAFERGGHAAMAKRLMERRQRPSRPVSGSRAPAGLEEGVRSVAEMAFSELEETGELPFALAEPDSSGASDAPWHTLELGDAGKPIAIAEAPTRPSLHQAALRAPARTRSAPPIVAYAQHMRPDARVLPSRLVAPPGQPIVKHAADVLLVRVEEGQSFGVRLDALRVIAGTSSTRALHRRWRDAETNEVLGGIGSPLVRIAGASELVLAARSKRELAVVTPDDDPACVLEDLLFAFDLGLTYENARVRLDADGAGGRTPPGIAGDAKGIDGSGRNMTGSAEVGVVTVQLRGSGAFVLELAGKLGAVPCISGRPLLVRREWIVGWLGPLVARVLPPGESPNGQRGLVGFTGEGTVLLCSG